MIWFEVAGYLLVGAYLGYRFRLRQGDSNLDHGERAFLTV